jgi:ketosteroid isomerase-like protein
MNKMLCLLTCLACFSSSSFANESPQALQNAFMAALKANNVQGLADCYTGNAVNFPVGTLVGSGPESVIESWSSFFAAYKVVDASLSETHLEIHGDTAVAWGLFTIMAEPAEGGDVVEMKGRYMDVARNMDGTWLYVADHASMPLPAPEE